VDAAAGRAVPLAQHGWLARFRRLPFGHGPQAPQEHPPGAREGGARRRLPARGARRRGQRRGAGGDARVLPAHLRRVRQPGDADAGLPAPPGDGDAAVAGAGARLARGPRHRRGLVPARWGHALRPLLGRRPGRARARAAFRDLLLPGHRVLSTRGARSRP
jgi:hypothetical protein